MQISKTKTGAIAISLLLILSIGTSLMLIPTTSAHTPAWSLTTYAYITASPNPIGVGQQMTVYMWLANVYGTGGATADYAQLTNNYRFSNFNLTVIQPDGSTNTTIYPYISDPTSSMYAQYTPTQTGNYTFLFNYPGQVYGANGDGNPTSVLVNDTYLPSSASTTVTVQQTATPSAVGSSPLPTAFWMRPIYGENTVWFTISSNWLGIGSPVVPATGSGTLSGFNGGSYYQVYPGDAVGPLTGHVMWTYPLVAGGVVGGLNEPIAGDTYNDGSAYLQRFDNPIIIDGNLYYRAPISTQSASTGPETCQNLETGQIVWSSLTMPTVSFGYLYDHQDANQHGVLSGILFTSNFGEAFDAATGDWLFNVTNVPSSSATAMGPSGEQLKYVFANAGTAANPNWGLAEWNSSKLWTYVGIGTADILTPTLYNYSSTTSTTSSTIGIAATTTTGLVSIPTLSPAFTGATTPYVNTYLVNGGIDNVNSPFDRYDWNTTQMVTNAVGSWLDVMGNQTLSTLANGTIAKGYSATGSNPDASNPVVVEAVYPGNMMLCRNGTYYNGVPQTFATYSTSPYTYFAVNLNATVGAVGSILWMNTPATPPNNYTVTYAGSDPTTNTFAESYQETMQFVGYSLTTGQQVWGPTPMQAAFDYYGNPIYPFIASVTAYGNLYSASFAGIVYCYSMATGSILWTYGNGGAGNSTYAGFNTPYGDYPTMVQAIGNGVIYTLTCEHTVESPIYKGALARAINATTGQEIWTLSNDNNEFSSMSYAIADGYAVTYNGYDNSIYSIGQGPSQTKVSAGPEVTTLGSNVVISGTVMDVSAGTQQTEQKADFPNGVPVSSDASMKDWMGYVYQQQPLPTNFTGVPVQLYVLDSNGNHRLIGTAKTDTSGMYTLSWTPDIAGNYTVYAQFAGTNGYWPSSSETSFNVMNAASPTMTPTATPTSVADQYFVPFSVAIIVVIIIIGAVLALLILRKKA